MNNANNPRQVRLHRKSRRTGAWLSGVVGCMFLLLVATFFSIDPTFWSGGTLSATASHFQTHKQSQPPVAPECDETEETDETQRAVCRIGSTVNLLDTFWSTYLPQQGFRYASPKAVFFEREVSTDCGFIRSTSGTFYCQLSETLYYDLNFFKELYQDPNEEGGIAAGKYAVSQDFGHHVQNLTGDLEHAHKQEEAKDKTGKPVKESPGAQYLELQADCFVGLWTRALERESATPAPGKLTAAQAEKALGSLESLSLRRQSEAEPTNAWEKIYSTPTHRTRWYAIGYDKGDFSQCNTFKTRQL